MRTRGFNFSLPFCPGLLGMELASLTDELQIPRACGVDAGHKRRRAPGAGITDTKRSILQTERRISDGRDSHVVTDTWLAGVPADASDDADFVLEGEAREGGLGLCVRLVPGQLCCALDQSACCHDNVWSRTDVPETRGRAAKANAAMAPGSMAQVVFGNRLR
jgi:hypothetical protein